MGEVIEFRRGPFTRGEVRRLRDAGKSAAAIYTPASPPRNAAEASAEIFAQLWLSVELGKQLRP